MGKKLFTFFLFGCIVFQTFSQEKYIKRAQKLVDKERFEEANFVLEKVDVEKSAAFIGDYYILKGLVADGLGQADSAAYFWGKGIEKKNLTEIPNKVIVEYAKYKFSRGEYDATLDFIRLTRTKLGETKYPIALDRVEEQCFWAITNKNAFSSRIGRDSIVDVALGENKLLIDVPRFGAAFYNDSLVFPSYKEVRRPTRTEEEAFEYNAIVQDYNRTNTNFYIASLNDNIDDKKSFATELATLDNEGALAFNKDQTEMYYTKNTFKRGKEYYSIHFAKKENNVWIPKGPVNFNSDEFNCMHPAVSPDGKGLYFVSNNPGCYGGYDIYYAEGSGQKFEKPKNMGPNINTGDNEIFPYMYSDSVMIFSSNGHLGFGGFDIFWTDLKEKSGKSYNLLQPINSVSDDYCIVGNPNNKEQMLFFSDRNLSSGNMYLSNLTDEKLMAQSLSFKISLLPWEKQSVLEDNTDLIAESKNSLLRQYVDEVKAKEIADNIDPLTGKVVKESELKKASSLSNQVPGQKWLIGPDGQPLTGPDGKPLTVLDESVSLGSGSNILLDQMGRPVAGINGKPVIVSNGNVRLSPDGQTYVDAKGNPILGANGTPLTVMDGVAYIGSANKMIVDAEGNPVLDAQGNPIIVKDGNITLASDGVTVVDAIGKPILAKDGTPITVAPKSMRIAPDGKTLLGADGRPVIGVDGKPVEIAGGKILVSPDGKTLVTPDGEIIKDVTGKPIRLTNSNVRLANDGKTLMGADGKPVKGVDGNPIVFEEGVIRLAADGSTIVDAKGNPINGFDGKHLYATTVPVSDAKSRLFVADVIVLDKDFKYVDEPAYASVYFDLNSSKLSDEAANSLRMLSEYLKAKKAIKLVISGSADMRGNDAYNLIISANRAQQTYDFLTAKLGLPASSFILQANGKFFPVVNTFDVNKGLKNRRVDIKATVESAQEGMTVNFKLNRVNSEEMVLNLFDLYLEQNPNVDYLHRVKEGEGMFRIAINNKIKADKLILLNKLGTRNFLYKDEIILVKSIDKDISEMVFNVRVKTLYYVEKETDINSIALKFNVPVNELIRVNKLEGKQLIDARTKLIIPISNR